MIPDRSQIVYCAWCIASDGSEVLHIFSTPERRQLFIDADDKRTHVSYDYTLDAPERHEEPVRDH